MIAEKRKFFFSFLSVQRGCVCYDSSTKVCLVSLVCQRRCFLVGSNIVQM